MSTTDRAGCSAASHGTRTAYRNYGCTCPDAVAAHARYQRARLAGRAHLVADYTVDSTGPRRRMQALYALGHRERDLAYRLGYKRDIPWMHRNPQRIYASRARAAHELYEALSGTQGPSHRLRARAASWGWYPPLAWDDVDIDDPDAQPDVGTATSGNDDAGIDEIAVARAVHGSLPAAQLRHAERLAAVDELISLDIGSTEIADRLGSDLAQVKRDRSAIKTQRNRARKRGEVSS